ncbi:MAG: signal peptide peptidase SppA [Pseudomonadota bacterium]
MSLDIDAVIDRRNLRKKLTFWRIAALVVLALALIFALSASGAFSGLKTANPHIARIEIGGMITEDRKLLSLIKKVEKNENVKGVILAINSPGGTTVGGEAIFEAVRSLSEKKPVTASVGTLAASAGYMIATASDHIVARRSSIVGSIGVIFQYPQASELLDKIGVQVKEIKSSPLKAEPSPFHVPPPGAEEVIKVLIDDSYNWFVDLVTERRPLNRAEVLRLADGRIFSGDRGFREKLVDELGGEETAKSWLVKEKGLSQDFEILDWKPEINRSGILFGSQLVRLLKGTGAWVEMDDINSLPGIVPKRLFLEGLLSIHE